MTKYVTWIHDIKMNLQEKFKIRIVQMSFSPELHTCDCEELKQREDGWSHHFLHEFKTIQSKHGLGEKQEQKEIHVVGLIKTLPKLSWISWSKVIFSHGDVTFVFWWMKMGFLVATRLLLPVIRCRGHLLQ